MSVDDDFGEEELKGNEPSIDPEGEIIYDPHAARPNHVLFTLRANSCLDYHSMIELSAQKPSIRREK